MSARRQSALNAAAKLAQAQQCVVNVWCYLKNSMVAYSALPEGKQPASGYVIATAGPDGSIVLRP